MPCRLSRARSVHPRLLQREIPLRRTVRVVDQHQRRIILQSLRLLNHCLLVLPHKALSKKGSNRGYKWNRIENIPRRVNVNAARICNRRSYSCETGKPFCPAANRFIAPIRQNKVDGRSNRLAIHAQQFIRSAVPRRRMRRHAKSIRNRLEVLFLLVDRSLFPPPPSLMHKRPMRRVHQSDNAVVHIAGQVSGQMRAAILRAELRSFRNRRLFSCPRPSGSRLRNIHPRISIALFARKSRRINLCRVQRIHLRERRNLHALAARRLKGPPMIFTGNLIAVEPSARQRNAAMRAAIAHGKQPAVPLPAQNHGYTHQHRGLKLPAAQTIAAHRRIPVVIKQRRRRRLKSRRHGLEIRRHGRIAASV